jgi:hypothetical protein
VSFFSDGDITPELTSHAFSRPSTPKSDTELEVAKKLRRSEHSLASDSNQWDWNWVRYLVRLPSFPSAAAQGPWPWP